MDGRKIKETPKSGENKVDLNKILSDLKTERDRLNRAISALEGSGAGVAKRGRPVGSGKPAKKRRGLTDAGRKRLSELMKKRWAERKRKGA